jgi:hypothetical protein
MALTPGLSANIRQPMQALDDVEPPADVIIDDTDDAEDAAGGDRPEYNSRGEVLRIEHEDGSVTISLDGRSLVDGPERPNLDWFDNLVDEIDDLELNRISDDLLRGIRDDLDSRKDWVEDRANGIKLLGLKLEVPSLGGAVDGAPVEGMSRVRHPLLLEAVLRFQANARSELLPADGPVKVRVNGSSSGPSDNVLAEALEADLNHYLTSVASEYYPDTDRMLLMLGFGGTGFKKVYFCPLRERPVSETVDADDLIVNNAATDLTNAKRITHRSYMRPSTVKRLQILGVYRDVELEAPKSSDLDSVQREQRAVEGLDTESFRPEDRDREIYECYCELNLQGFEHKWKGKVTGLEVPYRVTIDASSKKILSIARNYDEETAKLPEPRPNFVKFTFVPGFGFYDLGLLHILGNTTNAITAAWRELLDAGMYSNFPGFLMADTGARQNTNIFRVPPGGGALVKTGGMPISQAIMPLPYKEPSAALMSLVDNIAQTGMRVGGTSEAQVGEGRADAPVGTTLAMIDQATKVMNAVHKRLHSAQAEEFRLLCRTFQEHPESFWQRNRRPSYKWDEQKFLTALDDYDLTPQADPNTASHTQRIMKVMALKQLQAANPNLYDAVAIDTAALQAIGWNNPEQFMTPQNLNQPSPEVMKGIADAQAKQQEVMSKIAETNAKTEDMRARTALDTARFQAEKQEAGHGDQHKTQLEIARLQMDGKKLQIEEDAQLSSERLELVDLAQSLAVHPESAQLVAPLMRPLMEAVQGKSTNVAQQRGGLVPPGGQ